MQANTTPVVTEFKVEPFDPASPPAHIPTVHEKEGVNIRARNRYATKGIPELISKMTGALMSGGFDAATMNFPSNMYYHQSNGELAIQETAPASYYLDLAAQETEPVERIKYMTCVAIGAQMMIPRITGFVPTYPDQMGDTL